MKHFRVTEKSLFLNNGTQVLLPFSVLGAEEVDDVCVVCLDAPVGSVHEHKNVFGISKEGKVLWQIEAMTTSNRPVDTYVAIGRVPERCGVIEAAMFGGDIFTVDVVNGRIIGRRFGK